MQQGVTGKYFYVSLEDAIQLTKTRMGIKNTSQYDDDIETYITHRLLTMGGVDSFSIQNKIIDVIDGIAELPMGVQEFLAVRFCDEDGRSYGAYYVDFSFLDSCNCDTEGEKGNYLAVFNIVNNQLVFKNISDTPSKVTVAYRGYVTDADNMIMIKDYMASGLSWYAAYEIELSKPSSEINMGKVDRYKANATASASSVRSTQAADKFGMSVLQNNQTFSKKTISFV